MRGKKFAGCAKHKTKVGKESSQDCNSEEDLCSPLRHRPIHMRQVSRLLDRLLLGKV